MAFFRRFGLFMVCGVLIESGFAGMLALGDVRSQMPAFFMCYGLAAAGYLFGVWQYRKMPLWGIVGLGVVFRFTLVFMVPGLSDDIYRYVWDGRMQHLGINPYRYAPNEVAHLGEGAIFPNINHAELPTIYPPAAQVLFLLGYVLHPGIWGIKWVVVLADGATVYGLFRLLQVVGANLRVLLIYWWHPLIVVEGAGSGHIDAWGIALLIWALFFLMTMRGKVAFVFLGGAVLIKLLPLVFAPFFVRLNKDWLRHKGGLALILPAVLVLGYLPYAITGAPVLGILGVYAQNWEFNNPVFYLLRSLLNDGLLVRKILGVGLVIWVLILCFKRLCPLWAAYLTSAGFLLLTPTLHPWYAIWLVPFLVFYRQPAWIGFTLLLPLSYHVLIAYQAQGIWREDGWIWGVEFGALIGLGIARAIWLRKWAI